MKNNDKHNHLSAEELFKLLEEKEHSSPSDNSNLDDFEREALEGFSMYSSAQKAKELHTQINGQINDAVADKKSKPASKIIWFSAAASILLIIVLSMFFLKENTSTLPSTIALNTEKDNPEKEPSFENNVVLPKQEVQQNSIVVKHDLKRFSQKAQVTVSNNKLEEKKSESEQITTANQAEEKNSVLKDNSAYAAPNAPIMAESSSSTETFSMQKNGVLADEVSIYNANKPSLGLYYDQKAKKQASTKETVTVTGRTKVDAKEMDKLISKNTYTNADSTAMYAFRSLDMDDSKPQSVAFYKGGNDAVKSFIIKWLGDHKQPAISQPVIYKIQITVSKKGTVKVNSISSNTETSKQTFPSISKALNAMNNWVPAVNNSNTVASTLWLELSF